MSRYFRNSEENDIQVFVLLFGAISQLASRCSLPVLPPHQKPPGHLLTRSTSLPTFGDEPGVQLHLCWGLSLCVWHTTNARLSKCQSMPADAHWDLEHHRFHRTNKCLRTWQGSCRLYKGRKTCQGWFSYRLGTAPRRGAMGKADWTLGVQGEIEKQASSLQPRRSPVSTSRGSSFLACQFPEEEEPQSYFQLPKTSSTNVGLPSYRGTVPCKHRHLICS